LKLIGIKKTTTKDAVRIQLTLIISFVVVFVYSYIAPFKYLIKYFSGNYDQSINGCPVLYVFGIPCPLCGMTRSLYALIDLDFSKSMYYNPSSVVFYTFLVAAIISIFTLSIFKYKFYVINHKAVIFIFVFSLATMWLLNIFLGHTR